MTARERLEKELVALYNENGISPLMPLLDEVIQEAINSKWIKVEDQLPESGYSVLVVGSLGADDKRYVFIGIHFDDWNGKGPRWYHNVSPGMVITHWQPLPEAPKE